MAAIALDPMDGRRCRRLWCPECPRGDLHGESDLLVFGFLLPGDTLLQVSVERVALALYQILDTLQEPAADCEGGESLTGAGEHPGWGSAAVRSPVGEDHLACADEVVNAFQGRNGRHLEIRRTGRLGSAPPSAP
jgi:hypothetical protein